MSLPVLCRHKQICSVGVDLQKDCLLETGHLLKERPIPLYSLFRDELQHTDELHSLIEEAVAYVHCELGPALLLKYRVVFHIPASAAVDRVLPELLLGE